MKKKIIAILLVLVALISTVGVGFASWVISRPVEEVKQGTIQVDNVTEDSLDVTFTWGTITGGEFSALTLADDEPLLNLVGPTANSATAGDWLTYSNENTFGARLEVTLKIEVKRHSDNALFTGTVFVSEGNVQKDNIEAGQALSTQVASGVDAGLITGPVYSNTLSKVALEALEENHIGSYEVTITNGVGYLTITLGWGEHFGSENPYDYYNSHEADEKVSEDENAITFATDAAESLQALNTMLGGDNSGEANVVIGYTVYASASDAEAWTSASSN